MNEYLIQGVSATQPEVYLNIVKLKTLYCNKYPNAILYF